MFTEKEIRKQVNQLSKGQYNPNAPRWGSFDDAPTHQKLDELNELVHLFATKEWVFKNFDHLGPPMLPVLRILLQEFVLRSQAALTALEQWDQNLRIPPPQAAPPQQP